jgi:hypothetical protein
MKKECVEAYRVVEGDGDHWYLLIPLAEGEVAVVEGDQNSNTEAWVTTEDELEELHPHLAEALRPMRTLRGEGTPHMDHLRGVLRQTQAPSGLHTLTRVEPQNLEKRLALNREDTRREDG